MKFSLIIPTIRATQLIDGCVQSIRAFEKSQDYEIIVVDDGSTPEVQDWLRTYCSKHNVKLHLKPENCGFAHSVNVGLNEAKGDYLVLVNNDILWTKPILDKIEAAHKVHPDIGVVGAKLLYPDMRIQHAGVIRFPGSHVFTHINKFAPAAFAGVNIPKYFVSVTGALFSISRRAFDRVGGFNENYFIACEDTEYCLRMWEAGFRVYYSPAVEAIHIEGYTRGNDERTKNEKGPEWYTKEKETVAKFWHDIRKYNLEALDSKVVRLNKGEAVVAPVTSEIKKLEIGCGPSPVPGYLHLDVRRLPHVEYVCDFSKEPLPFKDGELDEIMNNHAIEHISWRRLPFVLSEWRRTLKPGGRVFFRTPDLEFICRTYLEGKTTPEHPNDEGFIKDQLSDTITPAWWAQIKLFAGQDYDSNYHFLCFDFAMVKSLLERYGFERVTRLNIQPVYSPGELQIEAFRADSSVRNVSRVEKRILIRRQGALGDVILTTPIARRLRTENPDAIINVATNSGNIYIGNKNVNNVFPGNHSVQGYDRVVDLDLGYEKRPKMHSIDAFSMEAFGDCDYDKQTTLTPTESDHQVALSKISEFGIDPANMVIAHPAVTWRNRTWPREYWEKLLKGITDAGKRVVVVGSGSDFHLSGQDIFDFIGKFTPHQIAALMSRASCFVGNDSGILHVAGTTDVPIVGIFTSAKGEYRIPWRNGTYGHSCVVIHPEVSCYGCLHDEKPPVVFCDCRRGDFKCLAEVTPEKVLSGVMAICR